MAHWLERHGNASGEWCVADLRRAYRVCNYNHERHGGPHIHARGGRTVAVGVPSAHAAERIMRRFAEEHDAFDLEAFRKEVERWKSASWSG